MRYLHIKLLRDLRQNWQQFFSVFLMSLLSVLIFGSAGAIVYTRLKSGKNCDDCQTACPVKKEQIKR